MSSEKESSARRHQESADETEIVLPYTHTHTQLSLLPSPSLGNVFIAVLINNSTPATGEESGVTREREREIKRTRDKGRKREGVFGHAELSMWLEAKANPYMCICGFSVCVIVYICLSVYVCVCLTVCNCVHVFSFAHLF